MHTREELTSALNTLRSQQDELQSILQQTSLDAAPPSGDDEQSSTHTHSSFESHTEITRVITVLKDNRAALAELRQQLQEKTQQLQVTTILRLSRAVVHIPPSHHALAG